MTNPASSGKRARPTAKTKPNPVAGEDVKAAAKEVVRILTGKRIEAQVAELLTERDLVLNRGSEHGVEVGMRFKIINPRGTQIRDPETREVLGSVELVKVIVKVVAVQPKLAIARTFNTIDVPGTGYLGAGSLALWGASNLFGTAASSRVETLRSDEKFAQEDMDESQSYVKKGDPAIQVVSTAGLDF